MSNLYLGLQPSVLLNCHFGKEGIHYSCVEGLGRIGVKWHAFGKIEQINVYKFAHNLHGGLHHGTYSKMVIVQNLHVFEILYFGGNE